MEDHFAHKILNGQYSTIWGNSLYHPFVTFPIFCALKAISKKKDNVSWPDLWQKKKKNYLELNFVSIWIQGMHTIITVYTVQIHVAKLTVVSAAKLFTNTACKCLLELDKSISQSQPSALSLAKEEPEVWNDRSSKILHEKFPVFDSSYLLHKVWSINQTKLVLWIFLGGGVIWRYHVSIIFSLYKRKIRTKKVRTSLLLSLLYFGP